MRFWPGGGLWIFALLVLNYNIGFVLPQGGGGCEGEDIVVILFISHSGKNLIKFA